MTQPRGEMFIPLQILVVLETMIQRIDPPAPGKSPFSGAVVAGPFVFVAGQVGTDPKTGTTPSGFRAQTQNVLAHIEAKLSKVGCGLKDVVKATVFLSDIRGFEEMNEVYRAAFAPDFPARSTLEAHLARPEYLVEIEVVAFLSQGAGMP
jgi:2-iminobutanoate/2-iminopropanoate deaminase